MSLGSAVWANMREHTQHAQTHILHFHLHERNSNSKNYNKYILVYRERGEAFKRHTGSPKCGQ